MRACGAFPCMCWLCLTEHVRPARQGYWSKKLLHMLSLPALPSENTPKKQKSFIMRELNPEMSDFSGSNFTQLLKQLITNTKKRQNRANGSLEVQTGTQLWTTEVLEVLRVEHTDASKHELELNLATHICFEGESSGGHLQSTQEARQTCFGPPRVQRAAWHNLAPKVVSETQISEARFDAAEGADGKAPKEAHTWHCWWLTKSQSFLVSVQHSRVSPVKFLWY